MNLQYEQYAGKLSFRMLIESRLLLTMNIKFIEQLGDNEDKINFKDLQKRALFPCI